MLYDAKNRAVPDDPSSVFHGYVMPTEEPVLSKFCTELTGIDQEKVNSGKHRLSQRENDKIFWIHTVQKEHLGQLVNFRLQLFHTWDVHGILKAFDVGHFKVFYESVFLWIFNLRVKCRSIFLTIA